MELVGAIVLIALAAFFARKALNREALPDPSTHPVPPTESDALPDRGPSSASVDLSMLPAQFVIYDLETTGLDPDRHEIIEIAAIKVERDGFAWRGFTSLVIPQGRISSKISTLTGINRAMVKADGLPPDQVITAFRKFVGDLPLISFNAPFDSSFLRSTCDRLGLDHFPNEAICALAMARKAWPGRSSYRLTNLSRDFGIKVHSEHRALPDCERAVYVYVLAAQRLCRHHP